jgi:rhamnosyltransferase
MKDNELGPKISVIIPVKNGAATLKRCLKSIKNQTIADDIEIIVLNSMSTDDCVAIARGFNAKIIDIPNGTFNHGLTRNIGVQNASGELIYLTVQDAYLGASDMIEEMARHFDDAAVMGVMGHQAVPHERDKNPFLWYRPFSAPRITEKMITDSQDFKNLTSNQQQSLIAWDNVVAMYRKSALIEQPFVKTEYAEDWIWSYNALLKGWKLLHDSSLIAYHYHHQKYQYVFKSAYTINYHFYKFFKYTPVLPSLVVPAMQATYHLSKNKKLSFKEKIVWIIHNWSGRLAAYFSTLNFLVRLKTGGDSAIKKGYDKYCKMIPQGEQNK